MMRGKHFLALAVTAALAIGVSAPAAAQESPDDYADEWSEARRGDRDWMQRATEQLTTGPLDRLMGPSAEGAMKDIVERIADHIDQMYEQRRDPCLAAAVNQAHDHTIATRHGATLKGAAEMFLSAAGGATGGGSLAEFLGQTLYEQLKDQIKSRTIDAFKDHMRERMKQGLPVHFEDSNSGGPCTSEFRVIWDKRTEEYEFLFAGDCACNQVSCGKVFNFRTVPLRRWTITGKGTIVPRFEQLRSGDIKVTYRVGRPQNVQITADCCGEGERRYRVSPGNRTGNEWVGFVPRPQTGSQRPRRPQTGGTRPQTGQSGTTPPRTTPPPTPSGPPRRQIDIPEVPDRPMTREELEELGERLHATQERARDLHRAAVTYRTELDKRETPPSEAEIRDADAAVEEAVDAARRARAAFDEVMEKFNELDQQQQQSSRALDPASARMLAIHNAERAAVGVPPLRWDPALQAAATSWAVQLARSGRLTHAPREGRGITRENLSQGMIGWTPEQMLQSWVRERRDFIPGVYPNVTRTGRWQDVSHYTQMIWPETTSVGCGMATGSGYQWLVCRYSPGGNRQGHPVGTRRPL